MARGLPFTYGPSRTAPKSSTARAMGVITCREKKTLIYVFNRVLKYELKREFEFCENLTRD